jgi:hypothetical protein
MYLFDSPGVGDCGVSPHITYSPLLYRIVLGPKGAEADRG